MFSKDVAFLGNLFCSFIFNKRPGYKRTKEMILMTVDKLKNLVKKIDGERNKLLSQQEKIKEAEAELKKAEIEYAEKIKIGGTYNFWLITTSELIPVVIVAKSFNSNFDGIFVRYIEKSRFEAGLKDKSLQLGESKEISQLWRLSEIEEVEING